MKNNPTLPGFYPPTAGFEAPLEMLTACHHRIERQCETLLKLHAHVQTAGADTAAQQAAEAVIRYFDTAAVHHHDDEEKDLFPSPKSTKTLWLLLPPTCGRRNHHLGKQPKLPTRRQSRGTATSRKKFAVAPLSFKHLS